MDKGAGLILSLNDSIFRPKPPNNDRARQTPPRNLAIAPPASLRIANLPGLVDYLV
jgi:hypothetical protein